MALVSKLSDEELALLEVIEDPIWLGEYLRSTTDGSSKKEEWPKRPFEYRWYQKDLLTDKNNISLVAGRAVGKCSPATTKVYTADRGYTTIGYLYRNCRSFPVYALDKNNKLVIRRARVESNKISLVRRITTESGYTFEGTLNHPLLTESGWVEIKDINPKKDKIAVTTYLPWESQQSLFTWEELRYLGYVLLLNYYTPEVTIYPKYKTQVAELMRISDFFNTKFVAKSDGGYKLQRKRGNPLLHYGRYLLHEVDVKEGSIHRGIFRLPKLLKLECLENIKIFLEALFAMHAEITKDNISLKSKSRSFLEELQEVLLRFGIETRVTQRRFDGLGHWDYIKQIDRFELNLRDYRAYYRFFNTFKLPGVIVNGLPAPNYENDPYPHLRFEEITQIENLSSRKTYAIFVHEDHNYISENLYVHNSLVLEDKMVYEAINPDLCFPETKERLLATANQAQMDPIQKKLMQRFTHSRLLKAFQCEINKSKGTFDFPQPGGSVYTVHTRIAGSNNQSNLVGLHLPRIAIDESQLFMLEAYTQARHQLNTWEEDTQIWASGVPNGLTSSTLYFLDQKSTSFKKYRIPSHNNPYYFRKDDIENIKQYNGEDSDDYINLVLGRHGSPSMSAIPRECIKTEAFEFFSYRFGGLNERLGTHYTTKLQRPKLPEKYKYIILAVDPGYTDPTLAQILICDMNGIWRTHARYRLTRVATPIQAEIINWLDDQYKFDRFALDLGAGGGGIQLLQELSTEKYAHKNFSKRVHGVHFNERIFTGTDKDGNELIEMAKPYAGQMLTKIISEHELVFSEFDAEGVSQIERVAYQRQSNGSNKYFVLSETARERGGASKDDHIFASYICFVLLLDTLSLVQPKTAKLIGAKWIRS